MITTTSIPYGIVHCRGAESLDFLHRMSTNDLRGLAPGQARETVLTNEKGRVVDVVLVLAEQDGCTLLATRETTKAVRDWLERFTFMERIAYEIDTRPATHIRFRDIADADDANGIPRDVPVAAWEHRAWEWRGFEALLARHASVCGPGVDSIVYAALTDDEVRALAGADGARAVSFEEYERFRIARGWPAGGRELSLRTNPLEAGAAGVVSFTKGCYIGQEVIARLDSRDKVQRALCRWTSDDAPPEAARLPMDLTAGDAPAGLLTSAVARAERRGATGLAVVRKEYALAGQALAVADAPLALRVERVFQAGST